MLLIAVALARPVTHTASASPPDAHYLLTDRVTCPVHVVVAPDGRVTDVRVEGCAEVLSDAVAAAAGRFRFARAAEQTLEAIDVPVVPPSFTPKAKGRDCRVALMLDADGLRRLTPDPPSHCGLRHEASLTPPPSDRRTTAWCRVRVDADRTAIEACSEGYEAATRSLVEGLAFDERATSWTLLVGFAP
jgi:hypothetical protein